MALVSTFFHDISEILPPSIFTTWSNCKTLTRQYFSYVYAFSRSSRLILHICLPLWLCQLCGEIRHHSELPPMFWSCGSFRVFHHQFSTLYSGPRLWKKLIKRMHVHKRDGTRYCSGGKGRSFPDSFLFSIYLRNELGRPCFPFFFHLSISSLLTAGRWVNAALHWSKLSTQIAPWLKKKQLIMKQAGTYMSSSWSPAREIKINVFTTKTLEENSIK